MYVKKQITIIFIAAVVFLSGLLPVQAKGKTGLLIIGHGSRRLNWNKQFLKIEDEVKTEIKKKGNNPFTSIRTALMEMSEPSVFTAVKDMESKGINEVYVLPLFITPSSHALYDIPTILGLYYSKKTADDLKAEGIKMVDSKMKLVIGPGLHYGDLLGKIMLDRVNALSVNSDEEGVILLSHGSERFQSSCETINQKIGAHILSNTPIKDYDYAFVGIGQKFMTNGRKAITRMLNRRKKIIIIGLYTAMGADRIKKRETVGNWLKNVKLKDGNVDIRFSNNGVLPDKRVIKWIIKRGLEWSGNRNTGH